VSLPSTTYSTNPPREDSFPQENEIDSNGITFHSGYKWHVGYYGEVGFITVFIRMYNSSSSLQLLQVLKFTVYNSYYFIIHI